MTATLEPLERIVSGGHSGGGHDDHGHHAPKKKPKIVEELYDRHDEVKTILDTHKFEYDQLRVVAIEKVLRNKETGKLDYKKLDTEEGAKEFAKVMAEEGLERAVKALDANKPKEGDKTKKDQILFEYFGATSGDFLRRIREVGSDYNDETHNALKDKHMKAVSARLYKIAGSVTQKEHLKDIVDYMGAGEMLDLKEMEKNPEVAATMLRIFREEKERSLPYTRVSRSEETSGYIKDKYHKIGKEHPEPKGGKAHTHGAPAHTH